MDNLGGFLSIEIIPISAIGAIGVVDNKASILLASNTTWKPIVTPESITVANDTTETSTIPSNSKVATARIPDFELTDLNKLMAFNLSGHQCVAVVTAANEKKWLLGHKLAPLILITKQLLPGEASGFTGLELNLSSTSSYYILELVAD